MGQQQLLLLVLGIVIVGIAVIAGIQAFGDGSRKADGDALASEALNVVGDVQAWKAKPDAFGGGTTSVSFSGISFAKLARPTTDGRYVLTQSGCLSLAEGTPPNGTTAPSARIALHRRTADGAGCDEAEIGALHVTGLGPDEVDWE